MGLSPTSHENFLLVLNGAKNTTFLFTLLATSMRVPLSGMIALILVEAIVFAMMSSSATT